MYTTSESLQNSSPVISFTHATQIQNRFGREIGNFKRVGWWKLIMVPTDQSSSLHCLYWGWTDANRSLGRSLWRSQFFWGESRQTLLTPKIFWDTEMGVKHGYSVFWWW